MNNFIETLNPVIHSSLLSALKGAENRDADFREDDRCKLYREAVDRISLKWTTKTTRFVSGLNNPAQDFLLLSTEELDRVWINGRTGKAGTAEFKEALKTWEKTYEKIIGDSQSLMI